MPRQIELTTVIKELHNISGFRVSVYDINLNEISAYPKELSEFCRYLQQNEKARNICIQNDATAFHIVQETEQVYLYQCRFGLYEAVAPLYHFGILSGYLMMGQTLDALESSRMQAYQMSNPYVADKKALNEIIGRISTSSKDKILSCIFIMNVCAEYITLTNRFHLVDKNLAHEVKRYINQHYANKITINLLCKEFFCSRSTLINTFKKNYQKTIIPYLTEVRLLHSIQMLENSGASIGQIAEECGFIDQNYFTKVFSKAYGTTPSQYIQEFFSEE